jgi:hypothetical protein
MPEAAENAAHFCFMLALRNLPASILNAFNSITCVTPPFKRRKELPELWHHNS